MTETQPYGAAPLLPPFDPDTTAFWTGGAAGRLMIARCADCGLWLHPPQPVCRRCRSERIAPEPVSGLGTLFSYTVNVQAWNPRVPPPYVVALVELDEQPGLRLTTNLVDVPFEDIRIGMPVAVLFDRQGSIWRPLFRPAAATHGRS